MWDSTVPTTTTEIRRIASIFPRNWQAFDAALSREHYGMQSDLAGRHKPGLIPVIFTGTDSEIIALTGDPWLAFNTTYGQLMQRVSGTWKLISTAPRTHVYATIPLSGGDILVPSSGSIIPFREELTDTLAEYDPNAYTFSPKDDGYFMIQCNISTLSVGGVLTAMIFTHMNSGGVTKNTIISQAGIPSADRITLTKTIVLRMVRDDKLHITLSHTRQGSIIVEAGNDRSFLSIERLS